MISAILYRKNGSFTGYHASGHSGYAEAGQDIVCAGVSVLGCTCVNAMESLLGVLVTVRANEDGLLAFDLPAMEPDQSAGAQLLMGALGQGLSDLQEAYPGYLKFEIKERRK
ncbi:MAG: ribosomal-processing cysteine protease Prp [Clostridia bacterium]|nr:ribosomal-processing cysteine protease Prp [Clostridia bacterium]